MPVSPLEIAVVGCGSAGAAATLFLHRAGHRVRLFERAPEIAPIGAGLLLQPTGLAVLEALGVLERALALGHRVTHLRSQTRSGRRLLALRYGELDSALFGLGIHRSALLHVLLEGLADEGVQPETGIEISVVQKGAGRRWLHSTSGERLGPFDLVVAADGARGHLRALLGVPHRVSRYPWGALWALVPDPDPVFSEELYQVVDGSHTMLGFLPTGHRPDDPLHVSHTSLFWSLRIDGGPSGQGSGWRGDLGAWKDQVRRLEPRSEALLAHLSDASDAVSLTSAEYHDVTMPKPYVEGAVVLGDAAHAMSPQLGQGANLGLFDAMEFANALTRCSCLDEALPAYHRARRSHVAFYQRATRWLTPLFQSSSRGAALTRNVIFPTLSALGPTRRQMTRALAGLMRGVFHPDALG